MPSWHEPGENNPPTRLYRIAERVAVTFLWAMVVLLLFTWVYDLAERLS